jgi:hypothetical protein
MSAFVHDQPLRYPTMTKTYVSLASALLFSLALVAGGAVAGDGKSCGGKKKDADGGTALIVVPGAQLG